MCRSSWTRSWSPSHYIKSHYLDHTFRGLYRWNTFDTCLLVPYFIVMVILAFYGIHRYQLVWLYFRNRKNEAKSHVHGVCQRGEVTASASM